MTTDAVVRDTTAEAEAAWTEIARRHDLEGRTGSDGSERGLSAGGPVDEMAAVLDADARLGIAEVMFTFRDPFDLETIERVGELRAALRS